MDQSWIEAAVGLTLFVVGATVGFAFGRPGRWSPPWLGDGPIRLNGPSAADVVADVLPPVLLAGGGGASLGSSVAQGCTCGVPGSRCGAHG